MIITGSVIAMTKYLAICALRLLCELLYCILGVRKDKDIKTMHETVGKSALCVCV